MGLKFRPWQTNWTKWQHYWPSANHCWGNNICAHVCCPVSDVWCVLLIGHEVSRTTAPTLLNIWNNACNQVLLAGQKVEINTALKKKKKKLWSLWDHKFLLKAEFLHVNLGRGNCFTTWGDRHISVQCICDWWASSNMFQLTPFPRTNGLGTGLTVTSRQAERTTKT